MEEGATSRNIEIQPTSGHTEEERTTRAPGSQPRAPSLELCDYNPHAVMQLSSWNKNKCDFLEGWLLKIQGLASRAQQSTPVTVIYFVLLVVA